MNTHVLTFGCRLNTFESEVIEKLAREAALQDTIIINTCAVTQEAERQARQAIRRSRRAHPHAKIIVTGCSAQTQPEFYLNMAEVDQVVGNIDKLNPATYSQLADQPLVLTDIMQVQETAGHLISGFESRTRAFIEIQNGCNHRCTYCLIPYGRGNNRSVPIAQIAKQVSLLIKEGVKEIVFTGVDITDYGLDLPGQPTLWQLVRRILALYPTLFRLRLSSIDPAEVNEEFYQLLATEPRLMPHFHLSFQSGDGLILKRMKRRHQPNDVRQLCTRIRSIRPDAALSADVLTGFPTETQVAHAHTLQLLKDCEIAFIHIFPYSARPGTPAAKMPAVAETEIKKRAQELRDYKQQAVAQLLKSQVGNTASVLWERGNRGHSEHFFPIRLSPAYSGDMQIGEMGAVLIESATPEFLVGMPLC